MIKKKNLKIKFKQLYKNQLFSKNNFKIYAEIYICLQVVYNFHLIYAVLHHVNNLFELYELINDLVIKKNHLNYI